MEPEIKIISDHVEIHPGARSGWAVVRDGSVYGTYESLDEARELAEELAGQEKYEIVYYLPDGQGGPVGADWTSRERHVKSVCGRPNYYASIEQARAAIHGAVGNHGSFGGEEDGEIEAWNESDAEGCGCFVIRELASQAVTKADTLDESMEE